MSAADTEVRRTATICNRRGLHARAAAKFVKLVATFDAQVHVSHRGTEVSGMSIMGLMMLAAAPGTTIMVEALGSDADAVVAAIEELVGNRFGEDE